MQRFESLDWLRGLMAVVIMVYHYGSWMFGGIGAGNLIGNLGIYGVAIFFVLSGLSMAIVYHSSLHSVRHAIVFFIKRLFRLLPLLWLCMAWVLMFAWEGRMILWDVVILNATLLFGFVSPSEYINVGAWSIGNECVYYALTPLILATFNHSKWWGNALVGLTILVGGYFAVNLLDTSQTVAAQWSTYVNPFNNVMLYACGVALYYNFHNVSLGSYAWGLIILSCACFTFYPISGNQIHIITGMNRVVFCLAAVALTLGFYKLNVALPVWLTKPLGGLGAATYGVYLLHPIVYQELGALWGWKQPIWMAVVCAIITVIVAHWVYRLYEKPCIALGKQLTAKLVR